MPSWNPEGSNQKLNKPIASSYDPPLSSKDLPEDTLLERIRILHAEQKHHEERSPEYRRLSAEINEASKAYCEALDAKSGVQRLARKA